MTSTALQTVKIGFDIQNIEEAMKFCKVLADSGLVPKDYRGKAGDVLGAILFGQEVGLSPLQSLQNVANINGRPAIWGDAAKALCEPLIEDFEEWFEVDGVVVDEIDAFKAIRGKKNLIARCRVKRRGKEKAILRSFSWEMALHAGYPQKTGTPWQTNPVRMIQMRPRGFALRDEFPDKMKGLYLQEELMGENIEMTETGDGTYQMATGEQSENGESAKPSGTSNGTNGASKLAAKMKMPKASATVDTTPTGPKASGIEVTAHDPQATTVKATETQQEPEPPTDTAAEPTIEVNRQFAKDLAAKLGQTQKGGAILAGICKDHKIKEFKTFTDDPAVMKSFITALQNGCKKVAGDA